MNQFRSVKNFFDEFFLLFLRHSSFIRHILLSFHNLFNGSLRQNQDEERGVSNDYDDDQKKKEEKKDGEKEWREKERESESFGAYPFTIYSLVDSSPLFTFFSYSKLSLFVSSFSLPLSFSISSFLS